MEILQAVILGIVQGIGEFLPISSSGHLVIAGEILKCFGAAPVDETAQAAENAQDMLMNVTLHFGTLLSILVVYRRELWQLFRQPRVCLLIVLASIPAGTLGLLLKDWLESAFATPLVAGLGLFVTAAMLVTGQRLERSEFSYVELPPTRAFLIGLFQAVALMPGISRSGSTITGGLLCGLKRESAAAFSFLMAVPVIGGAALLEFKDVLQGDLAVDNSLALLIGCGTAFGVGVISLRWLVSLIARGRLHWFAWYCLGAGTATVVWQLVASVMAIPAV